MVVDTTCMQAGLANPHAALIDYKQQSYEWARIIEYLCSHCRMQISATESVNSFMLNIYTECFSEYKITL